MIKKIFLTACLSIASFFVFGQTHNVVQGKYWFDNDYADTATLSVTPSTNVIFNSSISTSALSAGYHTFNFIAKDDTGKYSSPISSVFLKNNSSGIVKMEYWFDSNYAQHDSIIISGNIVTVDSSINVGTLQTGLHYFNYHFKSQNGIWSSPQSQLFLKLTAPNKIVAYRYWFDNAFNNSSIVINSLSNPVNISFTIDTSVINNLGGGNHVVHIQLKDTSGLWSVPIQDTFSTTYTGGYMTVQNYIPNNLSLTPFKTLYSGDGVNFPSPIKICADSSTATRFVFQNIDSLSLTNCSFKIRGDLSSTDHDKFGELINDSLISNDDSIVVWLHHPNYLALNERPFRRDTIDLINASNQSFVYSVPIEIYPAPIVFVHGLFGDATTFENMSSSLVQSNYDFHLQNIVDYKWSSLMGFQYNKNVVPDHICKQLKICRDNNFSAGKVNIISHSLGGIIARNYLQSAYGITYRNDINELITINTPHSGSQLANDISNNVFSFGFGDNLGIGNFLFENMCFGLNYISTGELNCGLSMYDLSVNSYGIDYVLNGQYINNTSIPSYTISTEAPYSFSFLPTTVCSALSSYESIGLFGYTIGYGIFNGEPSDLVVAKSSQIGGCLKTQHFYDQCHLGAAANTQVVPFVNNLLSLNPTSTNFSLSGFNPPPLQCIPPPHPNNSSTQNFNFANTRAGTVTILNPTTGSLYTNGDPIQIHVSGSGNINRIVLLAGYDFESLMMIDTFTSDFTTSYLVSPNCGAQIRVLAFGYDSLILLNIDSAFVNINPIATLDSFIVYPEIFNLNIGQNQVYNVKGIYSDGIEREITQNPLLQKTILNISIANLIPVFQINALSQGTTYLKLKFLNDSISLPINVSGIISNPQADFTVSGRKICAGDCISFTDLSLFNPQNWSWSFPGSDSLTSIAQSPSQVCYSSAGNYDVEFVVSNSGGFDTIFAQNFITVYSLPSASVTSIGNQLTSSSSINNQWYFNGQKLIGDTLQTLTCDSIGYYQVEVTNAGVCSTISDSLFSDCVNGINSISAFNVVHVFPNPNDGSFTVAIQSSQIEFVTLQIIDPLSRIISEKQWNLKQANNTLKVQLPEHASGIYLLRILGKDSVREIKIVAIEHP